MSNVTTPSVDVLIRAKHDRNIKEEPYKLFAAVRQSPIQGQDPGSDPEAERPNKEEQAKSPCGSAKAPGGSRIASPADPTARAQRVMPTGHQSRSN